MSGLTGHPSTTECGCTPDELVCAHHLNLLAYKRAFAGTATSALPPLVLRPTLKTFWSEFDAWRKLYLAILVIGLPAGAYFGGAEGKWVLLFAAVLVGLCGVIVLTMLVKTVTLDPADRVVRARSWRGRTATLHVDDEMRAAAFQYLGYGVTSFTANLVLWTPTAHTRLDSRQWGVDQLDSIAFVLGVHVGGLYGDADIAEAFPGVVPKSVKHPVRTALVILGVLLALVIGLAALFVMLTQDDDDGAGDERPQLTSVEVNGPKPSSLPADVTARQDALDESLKKVFASDVAWTSASTIRPCDEQPGWQRENSYSVQEGARLPDAALAAAFDTTVEKFGLVPVPDDQASGLRLEPRTEYGSRSGAGARAYIRGFEATDSYAAFASASIYTQSDCVITPG